MKIRFNDTFLFIIGITFFIGGHFTETIGSYFVFGLCFGTLIRQAVQDFKNKKQ
jgi:hypothetical protein